MVVIGLNGSKMTAYEYLKILLSAYSKTQQFSTSWWQLIAVLERYYHAKSGGQISDRTSK